jgi:hypothetical protein
MNTLLVLILLLVEPRSLVPMLISLRLLRCDRSRPFLCVPPPHGPPWTNASSSPSRSCPFLLIVCLRLLTGGRAPQTCISPMRPWRPASRERRHVCFQTRVLLPAPPVSPPPLAVGDTIAATNCRSPPPPSVGVQATTGARVTACHRHKR